MFKVITNSLAKRNFWKLCRNNSTANVRQVIPESADVVIIGGGSQGCHTLYHLAKRGVKAVLLERSKLTAGTTWHTAGLLWRLRPNDVDIQLLARSRDMLIDIKKNTEYDPGWIQNGGLFIARNKTRLDEYKRLATIGKAMGIESHILSKKEIKEMFPLLNTKILEATLYSPGDGNIDPTLLCNALTQLAVKEYDAVVVEDCPVKRIRVEENTLGTKCVTGVKTRYGDIKTNCVVNATGAWGGDLIEPLGLKLPLVVFKHAYIVSEPVDGIMGMPNIRDHDASIYFRIQGSSVLVGGYENNPILIDKLEDDFNFRLYNLDWSTFEEHLKGTEELCPAVANAGVKSTVCGPETFTPDHKPILGPDPRCNGLFHNCGYNSAGMMFGGGCGEQLAQWIIHGRPDIDMSHYDIRRFSNEQMTSRSWITERTHEAYSNNYSLVFVNDQPLAGRNFKTDPLHDEMLRHGAYMEERHGYERPAFFVDPSAQPVVQPYNWYGAYSNKPLENTKYIEVLNGDLKYEFSDHHNLIGSEALNCRRNAAVFNLSYFCKLYLSGPDAKKAIDWICTADMDKPPNSTIYTCALNNRGGVEANFTVTILESGNGEINSPFFEDTGYYIVAEGASSTQTIAHIKNAIWEKKYKVDVTDVSDEIGIISVQGRNSRNIVQELTDFELNDKNLSPFKTSMINVKINNANDECQARILRFSSIGELGFELHVAKDKCKDVYRAVLYAGSKHGLKNAGYRAFYSLNCEKGNHIWGEDLRLDSTPIEANLGFLCREHGNYKGKTIVDEQRKHGIKKCLVYLTLEDKMPLWGLEGVYRDGKCVGYLKRAEYGYAIDKTIGKCYVKHPDGHAITSEFLETGKYQIDAMTKLHAAKCHLEHPFDPKNQRVLGNYE